MKTKDLVIIALCSALIVISTFIKIPIGPVPITLQLPMVLLIGYLIGSKRAVYSVLLYILIGLIGVPVFTSGGGIQTVFSPTFGFVLGFLPAAFITGLAHSRKPQFNKQLLCGILSLLFVFSIGSIYFYVIMQFVLESPKTPMEVLAIAVVPFIIKDVISTVVTVLLANVLIRRGLVFGDRNVISKA